jgi:ppGpp synthetase/RelA/SpoT-type nucleotidyltranferase
MEIPPSFEEAFRREAKVGERIRRLAGDRLRLLCVDENWLFADRIKSAESALAKMQIGLVRELPRMGDLYGATIVVPTRNEVGAAVDAIRRTYPGAKPLTRTRRDPASFVYDDLHVAAALRSTAPGEPGEVREREFEIQVRTGLQYAWWRATHDKIYKGDMQDWRLQRVAGQVRGNLEMLDGILANLDKGADLLESSPTDLDAESEAVIGWLRFWPDANQPLDLHAYAEAVTDLLAGGLVTLPGGEYLLATDRSRSLIATPGLTPVQTITILIAELRGVAALLRRGKRPHRKHRKRWLLITDEMEQASSLLSAVPADRRSSLS